MIFLSLACSAAIVAPIETGAGNPPTTSETAVPESPPEAETGTAPETGGDTAVDPCAELPPVTWANFGAGFILENCQGCHASTAVNRYGAPDDVTFDTVDQCWQQADRVIARAAGPSPTMPPQGGTTEDDRTLLTWWLTCATPGT